jgi:hypothetical protein
LILQSGGAQQGGPDMYGAKRSSFFKDDYYIDNVEMEGFVSGTTTQSVHNQHTIRFEITEPYGLTFLENLHQAVKEYKTSLGFPAEKINYASQMYLMVIRFRGHGIDGVPVDLAEMNYQQTGERDTKGFTEKYIPFVFSGINFRVENDKIVYRCEASSPMSFYNLNATHAAIPFNVELNGGTVGDVLGDPAGNLYTAANFDQRNDNADIKRDTKVTVYTGLTEALNVESEKAYGKEFANRYKIIFEEGAGIENKKIILPGSDTNKERAPMKSSKEQPQAGNTDSIKKESRTKSLPAGTSIIQAIEQIVRNSEFVTEQQQIVINERTGEPKLKDKTSNQPFQWFKVVMQATPRSDKVNPKTHDYAYDIVYKIKRYQVGATNSPVFPPPIFRGVHKKYPYWFTGENTEVLHFQQDFNYLYYQTLTEPLPGVKPPEINTVHVARNYYMPRTNEANDGTTSGAGEISASVASTLYSPGDLATVEVEIIGDPDWIAQSEVFYGVDKISNDAFEEDGSVNFNSSVAYFGIEWNGPRDYNDEGLMDPRGDAQYTRKDGTSEPLMSLCYRANTIKTKLAQGQFTQVLSGTLEQWIDDPYTTRVDQGFKYNAQKRLDDITAAQESAEEAELDRAFAENDALWDKQMQGLSSAENIVAQQDAEFEAELLADRLADEDLAMNQGSLAPRTEEDFPEVFDQADADRLETWDNVDWGDDEIVPTSTQPALTKVAPTPTTAEIPNPNTSTQNTITKTGGDKTVTQTPLVEPTPVPPAYSGPGYTENESNLTLPTGTTNSGVDSNGQIYGNYKGQEILGGTQGAIDAQKQAIDTGQTTTYEDVEYGLTAGDAERVRRKFDPVSGTDEIVGYFNNKTGRWEDAFGNAIQ